MVDVEGVPTPAELAVIVLGVDEFLDQQPVRGLEVPLVLVLRENEAGAGVLHTPLAYQIFATLFYNRSYRGLAACFNVTISCCSQEHN